MSSEPDIGNVLGGSEEAMEVEVAGVSGAQVQEVDDFDEILEMSTQEQLELEEAARQRELLLLPTSEGLGYANFEETEEEDDTDRFLSTGCPKLDNVLNGGIALHGLTEIVGPAGLGKTQIALQLCITAQLPEQLGGLNCGVIYISTEGPFPSNRLEQLITHFKDKYGPAVLPDNPMDNILLKSAVDTGELIRCIMTEVPAFLKGNKSKKFGLLIVDSVAATFRSEFENVPFERIKALKTIGAALHRVAFNHNLALVAINQVRALIPPIPRPSRLMSANEDFTPALGNTWRNLVTTRIQLRREGDTRIMEVKFSPHIPFMELDFKVGKEGVFVP